MQEVKKFIEAQAKAADIRVEFFKFANGEAGVRYYNTAGFASTYTLEDARVIAIFLKINKLA